MRRHASGCSGRAPTMQHEAAATTWWFATVTMTSTPHGWSIRRWPFSSTCTPRRRSTAKSSTPCCTHRRSNRNPGRSAKWRSVTAARAPDDDSGTAQSRRGADRVPAPCGRPERSGRAAAFGVHGRWSHQRRRWRGELRRSPDQAACRFIKLPDSRGEKVLPGILLLTLDPLLPKRRSPRSCNASNASGRCRRLLTGGCCARCATGWRTNTHHPALQAAAPSRLLQGVGDLLRLRAHAGRYREQHVFGGG